VSGRHVGHPAGLDIKTQRSEQPAEVEKVVEQEGQEEMNNSQFTIHNWELGIVNCKL